MVVKLGLTQYAASADGKDFLEAAARLGVAGVEPVIVDDQSEFLRWSEAETARFREAAKKIGLEVPSVCVALFNGDSSLIEKAGKDRAVEIVSRALKFSAGAGANVILLCGFVVSNPDTHEKRENLVAVVKAVEPLAQKHGIAIGLELPLPAREFATLVDRINSRQVGIYYDFGNAIALGFDPAEEVRTLGPRIIALHVKDAVDKLASMHLGKGRLNLEAAMKALHEIKYDGWVLLESFGDDRKEIARDLEKLRRLMPGSKSKGL
jgi:sugar phosphate isomerase/epimerase